MITPTQSYCTPECRTIADLVEQDQLGDRLVTECAEELSAKTAERDDRPRATCTKTIPTSKGTAMAATRNYLLPRDLAWENVSRGMRAFLATRQIFCGAGKFGWEDEDRYVGPGFQIAQRSDFFSVMESVDTMQKRPLINTRDEPHADPETWRRFHVIVGDANMSPYATYLKVGSTASVLAMLNQVDPARLPST